MEESETYLPSRELMTARNLSSSRGIFSNLYHTGALILTEHFTMMRTKHKNGFLERKQPIRPRRKSYNRAVVAIEIPEPDRVYFMCIVHHEAIIKNE